MPSVAQTARAQSAQSLVQLASKPGSADFVRRSMCTAGTRRKRPRRVSTEWKSGSTSRTKHSRFSPWRSRCARTGRADKLSTVGIDSVSPSIATAELRKDLRLPDLVLMQVLLVTTETCIGIAARQGSTHLLFWIIGILFFFIPLAVVIRYLGKYCRGKAGYINGPRSGWGPSTDSLQPGTSGSTPCF